MADGKIVIDVILEDGSVAKGVANIGGKLGGLGAAGQKASFGIGKIVKALGLVALAKKGIDLVRDSVAGAVKRIDTFERFERVMSTVTGSTAEANRALKRTDEIVTGTGYTLDGAAAAVQNFVTRGATVDQATARIEAWGDAVAFYGDGSQAQFDNVTDALAKMQTKGTVGMDQLNRLFDAGIDAVGMYAQATGRSAGEVQDALSKGEISAEDFIDTVTTAMMEGTNGVFKIKGAAKDMGTSWGSVFANMKTAVARGVASIITSIDEMLANNGLPTMRDMVASFGKAFEGVLKQIAEKLPAVIEFFIKVYQALKPWLPLIASIVAGVMGMIGAWSLFNSARGMIEGVHFGILLLKEGVGGLFKILLTNPWLLMVGAAILAITMIILHWDTIKEFFSNLWESIKEISLMVWEPIKEAWQAVVDFLKALWEPIGEFFITIWESITEIALLVWEPIREAWTEVVEFFTEIWLDLSSFFSELWADIQETALMVWEPIQEGWALVVEFLKELWSSIAEFFSELWGSIVEIALTIWEPVQAVWTAAWEIIKTVVQTSVDNIKTVITTAWDIIKTITQTVWDVIKTVIQTVWDVIKTVIQAALDIIKTVIQTAWDIIKGIITAVLKLIQGDIEGAWNAIKTIISTVLNGIKTIISTAWNAIKTIISTVLNGIKTVVTTVWNGIKEVISTAVEAIKRNIKETFDSLKEITRIAFNAVKTAISTGLKEALDVVINIASQFKEAGKNIVMAIADGIRGAISFATDAMGEVTSAVRDFLPFSPAKRGALRDIMDVRISESIAESIDKGKSKALGAISGLTKSLKDELDTDLNLQSRLGEIKVLDNIVTGGSGTNSTTNYSNSKSYSPTINNYFTREESTPSEVARKNRQQQNRLALEWGY